MKIPKAERLIRSLMLDMRIKAFDKFVLMLLPYQPQNPDGSFQVSAKQLAAYARSSERTTSRALRTLAGAGYIELVEESTSSKGGFKIFFRSVALLATMLAMLGMGAALHKSNYSGEVRADGSRNYILSAKRRNRHKRLPSKPKPSNTESEIQTRRIVKTGQWALWNLPTPIHA